MSGICGIYQTNGSPVSPEIGAAMFDGFSQFYADYRGTWRVGPVFLACHMQQVTPESVHEKLPYRNDQADLTITADAIIDNRRELFDKLSIPHCDRDGMPDSLLILAAYQKWGQSCAQHLIGDFAFAIWDGCSRELFCAVDAVGTRTLYYCHRSGVFGFSTLINTLFSIPGMRRKYNDIWMADFLAMPCISHQLDPELTIYEEVFLLPAGHQLVIGPTGVAKACYWRITRPPELKLSSDTEYIEAFLEVFGEAVRCRTRCNRPLGVMMSGGLDSTSIACLAARELSRKGERLLAFSAVPMHGYHDFLPSIQKADETEDIEAVKQHVGTIDVEYCRSEGRHSLSQTTKFFRILEQPYKVFENLFWWESIFEAAQNKNVFILLDGGGGNASISWGTIYHLGLDLFKKGKWTDLLSELRAARLSGYRPERLMLRLLIYFMPYSFQKVIGQLKYGTKEFNYMQHSLINPQLFQQINLNKRFKRFNYDPFFIRESDSYTCRTQVFDIAMLSHGATIDTKFSLTHGIMGRRPPQDKRLIEFCLSIPENQFARSGEERRMIRRAMKGILPETIRSTNRARGQQSADWLQRLLPEWRDIQLELSRIGANDEEGHYLDIGKIKQAINRIGSPSPSMAFDPIVQNLIRALIFSRFIRFNQIIMKGGENHEESMEQTRS